MTRKSFRRLVQEETVPGANLLAPHLCVNSSCKVHQVRWLTRSLVKGMTLMKFNTLFRITALLVALCFSVAAFAKPMVKTINISQTAKVGQVTLQAGEYKLSIDGNKVSIQRGKEQVAESEGRWEERSTKSDYDAVLLGENGQVKEVRFYGQKRVFVFNE